MDTQDYAVHATRVTGKRYDALHEKHMTKAYDADHALNAAAAIYCVGDWQRSPAVKTQRGEHSMLVQNQRATYMIYVKQQRAGGYCAQEQ